MKAIVMLRLGRVSNLPTVWSNVLTGVAVAEGSLLDGRVALLLVVVSLFYTAGMFLNDAFDRRIDAVERPERPIPAGQIAASTVFSAGFAMLAAALGLLAWCGFGFAEGTGGKPLGFGLALAAAIVLYDSFHKNNPLSPLVMGVCRMLVYLLAGFALAQEPPAALLWMSLCLCAYIIGLTLIAKQENLGQVRNLWPLLLLAAPVGYAGPSAAEHGGVTLWLALFIIWLGYALYRLQRRRAGDVPRAVSSLIAGISLLDAVLISTTSSPDLAWLAGIAFLLTMFLQRFIAGT